MKSKFLIVSFLLAPFFAVVAQSPDVQRGRDLLLSGFFSERGGSLNSDGSVEIKGEIANSFNMSKVEGADSEKVIYSKTVKDTYSKEISSLTHEKYKNGKTKTIITSNSYHADYGDNDIYGHNDFSKINFNQNGEFVSSSNCQTLGSDRKVFCYYNSVSRCEKLRRLERDHAAKINQCRAVNEEIDKAIKEIEKSELGSNLAMVDEYSAAYPNVDVSKAKDAIRAKVNAEVEFSKTMAGLNSQVWDCDRIDQMFPKKEEAGESSVGPTGEEGSVVR